MPDLTQMLQDRYGLEPDVQAEYINQTIMGLLGRRVCRAFADRDLDEGLLNLLLACAQSAPTKSNLQQYSIIVVREKAKQKAITDLIPSMPWIADAPVFLTFLGDVRRIRRLANLRSHDYANNNADTFMNATVSKALSISGLVSDWALGAPSEGRGDVAVSSGLNNPFHHVSWVDVESVWAAAGESKAAPTINALRCRTQGMVQRYSGRAPSGNSAPELL